ncbi:LysR family transcriptional regulator [Rhodovastum atsumiense]|uniref:LysR family transcriptional regulator n=1 Tax=Rhodovastum atsumiense TaxID=504468 RepID=A0A5M6IT11_9PROT|nr:LysR family transcriptional regulator [Rhodovastum atsumiense]KAA5611392.1 LysR family transcriptional regulator [Rhodovastum atsumiense]CAH2603598.1 LysR family transcriptional regulator [Rhodovastum atsumiense]
MTRLTLAQFEAFYWTAHFGSAQRAADHLHIAQPTISLRLKDLRDAMGVELIQRHGNGLRLTQEGQALLRQVTSILEEVRRIRSGRDEAEIAGPIRFGLAEGFAATCLPPLVEALGLRFPALQPEWVVNINTFLEAALLNGGLDMAVLVHPLGDERLRLLPLGSQPTSWVVPAAWDLPVPLRPRDLWSRPILSNPPPSAMYRQIMGWFAAEGVEPVRISRCSSVAVIAELVAGGIGAGVLPIPMVRRHVASGSMRMVTASPPVENGRVFVGHHVGATDHRIAAVIRVLTGVLEEIDYFARGG